MTAEKIATKIIKEILEKYPKSRDCNLSLYAYYLQKKGLSSFTLTVSEMFTRIKENSLLSFETVTRRSRKLQETHCLLRGESWEQRQKTAKKYPKKELNYFD